MNDTVQVTVVLATYRPNVAFFKAQLASLAHQTLPFQLLVCDDSADETSYRLIEQLLAETLAMVPYTLLRNDKNCGSTQTFAKLITHVTTPFVAFCDQDDVWQADKLAVLSAHMNDTSAQMVYSDLSVIDESGQTVAPSFSQVNKRIQHPQSDAAFAYLLRRNMVTGCAMMMRTDVAKAALPIPDGYIHDHWLATVAAQAGHIHYIPQALVQYRIHGDNQVGGKYLQHIDTVADYRVRKVLVDCDRIAAIQSRLPLTTQQTTAVAQVAMFNQYRQSWFERASFQRGWRLLRHGIPVDWQLIVFEWLIVCLPKSFAKYLLRRLH